MIAEEKSVLKVEEKNNSAFMFVAETDGLWFVFPQ